MARDESQNIAKDGLRKLRNANKSLSVRHAASEWHQIARLRPESGQKQFFTKISTIFQKDDISSDDEDLVSQKSESPIPKKMNMGSRIGKDFASGMITEISQRVTRMIDLYGDEIFTISGIAWIIYSLSTNPNFVSGTVSVLLGAYLVSKNWNALRDALDKMVNSANKLKSESIASIMQVVFDVLPDIVTSIVCMAKIGLDKSKIGEYARQNVFSSMEAFGKSIKGVQSFIEFFVGCIQKLYVYVVDNIPEMSFFKNYLRTNKEKLTDKINSAQVFLTSIQNGSIQKTQTSYMQLVQFIVDFQEELYIHKNETYSQVLRTLLNSILMRLHACKDEHFSLFQISDAARVEPVCYMIHGFPGSGKTSFVREMINTAVYCRICGKEKLKEFVRNPGRFSYVRRMEQEFWDSLDDQEILNYDDWNQKRDIPGNKCSCAAELIDLKSDIPYYPHMANAPDKGKKPTRFKVICCTCNHLPDMNNMQSISEPRAVFRRFDLYVEPIPPFPLVNGAYDSSSAVNKTPDIADYEFKVHIKHPMLGGKMEMWSYQQVVDYLVDVYKQREAYKQRRDGVFSLGKLDNLNLRDDLTREEYEELVQIATAPKELPTEREYKQMEDEFKITSKEATQLAFDASKLESEGNDVSIPAFDLSSDTAQRFYFKYNPRHDHLVQVNGLWCSRFDSEGNLQFGLNWDGSQALVQGHWYCNQEMDDDVLLSFDCKHRQPDDLQCQGTCEPCHCIWEQQLEEMRRGHRERESYESRREQWYREHYLQQQRFNVNHSSDYEGDDMYDDEPFCEDVLKSAKLQPEGGSKLTDDETESYCSGLEILEDFHDSAKTGQVLEELKEQAAQSRWVSIELVAEAGKCLYDSVLSAAAGKAFSVPLFLIQCLISMFAALCHWGLGNAQDLIGLAH